MRKAGGKNLRQMLDVFGANPNHDKAEKMLLIVGEILSGSASHCSGLLC